MKKSSVQYFLKAYKDGSILYDFTINKKKLLLGSSDSCDIQINDSSISHYHVMIFLSDNGIEVQDLRSLNGLLINNSKVQSGFISSGDILQVGNIPFILEELEAESKVEISDEDEEILIVQTAPAQVGLKPIEGLTVIDGEYCNITFDALEAQKADLDTAGLVNDYVDFVEASDGEGKNILDFNSKTYIEVQLTVAGIIVDSQYLVAKNGDYSLSSYKSSKRTFCFNELNIDGTQQLLNFNSGKILLKDNDQFDLSDEDGIFYLTAEDVQLRVSVVDSIPSTRWAPFFELDTYFQKINAKTMGAVLSVFLLLLLIDTSLPQKPKKVAIIYKLQKPVAKKMKANDPVNNNSNPGQNKVDAPPKQKIAKKQPPKRHKAIKKRQVQKVAKAAPAKPVKKVTPIRTYRFKSSRSLTSFLKTTKSVKINSNTKSVASKSLAASTSTMTTKVNYNGVSNIKSRTPGSVARTGTLNSLGGRGLISKEGVDTSFATTKTVVLGSMDPEILRKILREYLPQFRQCYQQELVVRNNKLEGVIALDFRIGKSGKVVNSNIRIQSSSFSKRGTHCMNKVLSLIKFPKPKGGGFVDVTQPLNFYAEREVIN